jgi:hypothetical protein
MLESQIDGLEQTLRWLPPVQGISYPEKISFYRDTYAGTMMQVRDVLCDGYTNNEECNYRLKWWISLDNPDGG